LIIELIEASAPDELASRRFLAFARGTFPHTGACRRARSCSRVAACGQAREDRSRAWERL